MHVVVSEETVQPGETLLLDLSAIKASGFTFDQSLACTNENGVPISQIEGFTYPENPVVTGLTLHHQVPVSVRLSHAGVYICTAFLETPSMLENISDNANFTITIKCK